MGFRERRDIAHQDWCEEFIEGRIDSRLDEPQGNRGSDVLLMFQAKAEMPDKYREQMTVVDTSAIKESLDVLKSLGVPRVVEGTGHVVPEDKTDEAPGRVLCDGERMRKKATRIL